MRTRVVRLAVSALLAAAVAGVLPVQAQAQANKEQYQPQVGQAGKDVVWVPTPQSLVDKMLEMAKVTPKDHVIDLGSGDGRTVITAARIGATAHGIEYNADMVELSRSNAAQQDLGGRATFEQGDIFESDFSKATVITMFLLPDINLRLRPTILDLRPGTRIVSNSFTMEEWEPDQTVTVSEDCENYCTAFLWIVPARVAGTWQLPQGELQLVQEFQTLSGTLESGGKSVPITGARLRGDQIEFSVAGKRYTGTVSGAVMKGTAKSRGTSASWTATRVGARVAG
jgi:SAM-dependent methyltransferase